MSMEISPVRYPQGFRPTVRRGSSFDRFIPYRPGLNLEGAHHQLLQGFQNAPTHVSAQLPFSALSNNGNNISNVNTTATNISQDGHLDGSSDDSVFFSGGGGGGVAGARGGAQEYKRRLSVALDAGEGAGGVARILPFSCNTPPLSPALTAFAANYGSDSWLGSPKRDSPGPGSPCPYTPPRRIRPEPDTVLLLPLRDDFYCSLMDWGHTNSIAVGVDSGAYVWNATTGKCQQLQPRPDDRRWSHQGHVTSVRWDPNGKSLAFGYSQGSVLIWDAVGMRVSQDLAVPKHSHVGCLAWNSHNLYCGTSSGRVYQFDTRDNTPHAAKCPPSHRRDVCSVQLSPDESTLACGGDDGQVSVWEPRASSVIGKISAHKAGAKALSWCPWRRNILATGGGASDGHIRLWSVSACALKAELNTNMQVCSVLWSEEYRELVSAQSSADTNSILLWSAKDLNLQLFARLAPPQGRPLHQCLSPDGSTLASVSADERLSLWKLFPRKRRPVESMSPLNLDRSIR